MDKLTLAVYEGLISVWKGFPVTQSPNGDRIFIRHVDLGPEHGWDDWLLSAIIRPDGVEWIKGWSEALKSVVEAGLADNKSFGEFDEPDLFAQWVRSKGDGPPDKRVTDWA